MKRTVLAILGPLTIAACEHSAPVSPMSGDGVLRPLLQAVPPSTLEAKLTASDAGPDDFFGASVAMSGGTIVIGAPEHQIASPFIFGAGSAYVFRQSGTIWTEEAKLVASDAAFGDLFGGGGNASVAISGDIIVVGAQGDDGFSGSAYVFERGGSSWTEVAKLTGGNAGVGGFGQHVAIELATIVVGAPYETFGSALVFERIDGAWAQVAMLTASDLGLFGQFGYMVAISGDRILVGARLDNDNGPNSGSAYVFTRSGAAWIEEAKLTASDGAAGDFFGHSVSLDGDVAVVGAPFDADAGSQSGSAYVFRRNGTGWIEEAKLTATDAAAFDIFGHFVAVDESKILVGAPHKANGTGASYLFRHTGVGWRQVAKLTASDGAPVDVFGASVSISGELAVVGAPRNDDAGNSSGSAYVYYLPLWQVAELSSAVVDLVGAGVLSQGVGNSLLAKSNTARQQIEQGHPTPAINVLQAFVSEVNSLIQGGILSPADAQRLIDLAQTIIDVLSR